MLYLIVLPFTLAFIIAVISIPSIIKIADLKHLMDEPDNSRKRHFKRTPTLGGIAIFAGTIISYVTMGDYLEIKYEIKMMTPALIILFFAGIKDDILALSPIKKLLIQFLCAGLLTIIGNMHITSLWGMFGIQEISHVLGTAITFFLVVALINAYNLIDGIDGLAGSLGLIACLFFGGWFVLTQSAPTSLLAFSLAGSLLGFLIYNFKNAKIFMGDTGSMILGFIISILVIKFIEGNRNLDISSPFYIKASPAVAVAAVLIPLLDMTRLFFQRLLCGKSPFSADRSHIHHMLLDLGVPPVLVTTIIICAAISFILLSLLLREMRSLNLVLVLVGFAFVLKGIVFFLHSRKVKLYST